MRYAYLAGPIEYEGDTWREKAAKSLNEIGFTAIDPLRNEKIVKVGQHLESDCSEKLIVRRDLDDLKRTSLSGGLMLANLNTTVSGRTPIGTLFEIRWSYENKVPIVAIMGRDTNVNVRTHPWVKYCVTYEATSMTDAIDAISKYYA